MNNGTFIRTLSPRTGRGRDRRGGKVRGLSAIVQPTADAAGSATPHPEAARIRGASDLSPQAGRGARAGGQYLSAGAGIND
jgi:hypothetical protein